MKVNRPHTVPNLVPPPHLLELPPPLPTIAHQHFNLVNPWSSCTIIPSNAHSTCTTALLHKQNKPNWALPIPLAPCQPRRPLLAQTIVMPSHTIVVVPGDANPQLHLVRATLLFSSQCATEHLLALASHCLPLPVGCPWVTEEESKTLLPCTPLKVRIWWWVLQPRSLDCLTEGIPIWEKWS